MTSRRPSFQFYPTDWRTDPALRVCSSAARGLWMDMICLMHESEPYGELRINGVPVDDRTLSKLVGEIESDVKKWRKELETAGVFSRKKNGVIFSRRMERDENLRTIRAACGKKGGRPKAKEKQNKSKTKANAKQNITPSSSSSSSSSSSISPTKQALSLADFLFSRIINYKPDHRLSRQSPAQKQKTINSWAVHIDRMMRLDGRTESRIREVIRWATIDPFWALNIQSGAKLRDKFDQLEGKMKKPNNNNADDDEWEGVFLADPNS